MNDLLCIAVAQPDIHRQPGGIGGGGALQPCEGIAERLKLTSLPAKPSSRMSQPK